MAMVERDENSGKMGTRQARLVRQEQLKPIQFVCRKVMGIETGMVDSLADNSGYLESRIFHMNRLEQQITSHIE